MRAERREFVSSEERKKLVRLVEAFQNVQSAGWKGIQDFNLLPPLSVRPSEPNHVAIGREKKNGFDLFMLLFPDSIWNALVLATEARRLQICAEMNRHKTKYWKTPILLEELKMFIGWEMYWECVSSAAGYVEFLNDLRERMPPWCCEAYLIGRHRWNVISKSLSMNIPALANQLSWSFKSVWNANNIVAIDETIFAWLAKGNWTVFIPGKPHPKGLMVYIMACFSDKNHRQPYILGVIPHWGPNLPTPLDAAKQLMSSFQTFYR